MQRIVAFGFAWVVAAVVAMAVAWQGVGVVVEQVTDDRPAPLSAADVQAELERPAAATTSTTAAAPATTTTVRADDRSPQAAGTTATTARPVSPSTAVPQPTTTTSTTSPATVTRTYNLVGGSAALRFAPSGVTVLWANPNPGFEAEVSQEGSAARVELESESHRSRVDGWWDNGPQDRVREEPES